MQDRVAAGIRVGCSGREPSVARNHTAPPPISQPVSPPLPPTPTATTLRDHYTPSMTNSAPSPCLPSGTCAVRCCVSSWRWRLRWQTGGMMRRRARATSIAKCLRPRCPTPPASSGEVAEAAGHSRRTCAALPASCGESAARQHLPGPGPQAADRPGPAVGRLNGSGKQLTEPGGDRGQQLAGARGSGRITAPSLREPWPEAHNRESVCEAFWSLHPPPELRLVRNLAPARRGHAPRQWLFLCHRVWKGCPNTVPRCHPA
eukprot:350033-Chlamydomonas_euryale.AAC.13